MEILDQVKTKSKLKRIALEIVENHLKLNSTVLVGVNSNGYALAKLLQSEIKLITEVKVDLNRVRVNPASPLKETPYLEESVDLTAKKIILVDDVANTGRTLQYAMKPFLEFLPKGIEVAVLVDRKHKSFPVKIDYVGLSLATTMKENIEVRLQKKAYSVHLS